MVAANLAVAMARTHSAVILVCPSGQGTTGLLGVPESRRLDARAAGELAAGQLSVEEVALQPAGFPGLRVVVLGEDLQDLPHAQARVLAEQLRISADYAVIEAPAGSAGPDSLALAEYCGAAILAVEISVDQAGRRRGLFSADHPAGGAGTRPGRRAPASPARSVGQCARPAVLGFGSSAQACHRSWSGGRGLRPFLA